jgi:predicted Zn-dependent protease
VFSCRRTAIVAVALALGACGVSPDQETQIGQDEAAKVNAQLPILSDGYVTGYVNSLGNAIARTTSRADLGWTFSVVNTDIVNAFALPGGFIYVNRGLIDRSQSESELGSVLGHEIEHVVRRHSVKQMEKAQGANTIVGLACHLTNVCNSGVGQVAIQVGGAAVFARFSRTAEKEADEGGFQNEVHAGLDPRGMLSFFERLMAEEQRTPALLSWFADHPGTRDRIADVRRMLDSLPDGALRPLRRDSPDFQAMKRRLAELPPAPPPPPASR